MNVKSSIRLSQMSNNTKQGNLVRDKRGTSGERNYSAASLVVLLVCGNVIVKKEVLLHGKDGL